MIYTVRVVINAGDMHDRELHSERAAKLLARFYLDSERDARVYIIYDGQTREVIRHKNGVSYKIK